MYTIPLLTTSFQKMMKNLKSQLKFNYIPTQKDLKKLTILPEADDISSWRTIIEDKKGVIFGSALGTKQSPAGLSLITENKLILLR